MERDYGQMQRVVTERLRSAGIDGGTAAALAEEVLDAIGLAELLTSLEVTDRVIVAADGFHPVARFFVEDRPEQRYILDVLRRSR